MAEIKKMGYCVNGEWKESKAEKYMDVTDSSTGEVIAQVPCCTPDEVEEAIASAQAAFPEWFLTFSCKETAVYVQMERRSLCS